MSLEVRRHFVIIDEKRVSAGHVAEIPLRKVAVGMVVRNPFAGRYVEDLQLLIFESERLGEEMAAMALDSFGAHEVQSYGKGGIAGLAGEQEHANALLTTTFANPFRKAIGGADAWISSMTKIAAPGASIDIPMNHKDEVYVRSHYDGMSITVPECPMPDEILIVFCLANRGRLNARVGGLTHGAAQARRLTAATG